MVIRDPVRPLAKPLISEPAMKNEPDIDLENEYCLVVLAVMVRVLLRALPMPFV